MSVKRSQSSLYKFDPRPVNFRGASQQLLNDFVIDQQSYGAKYNESPMWLSLMRIKYDDFEIEDDYKSYLFEVSCQFVQNFYDSYPRWGPLQIPGTDRQAGSALWYAERLFRITASVC